MLGYVSFELAEEIDPCADVSLGWSPYAHDTASINAAEIITKSRTSVATVGPDALSKRTGHMRHNILTRTMRPVWRMVG